MVDLPTLGVVLATALVDSINPCAIGVLVILLSTLIHLDKKKVIPVGLVYISSVFFSYILAGIGLLFFIQTLGIAFWISYVVGAIIVGVGILELRDAFLKKPLLAISSKHASSIMRRIQSVTIPGSVALGIFVAAVELPCTGGPYLAITTILAQSGFSWSVFLLLLLYNFIFVLPLIIIFLLVAFGMNVDVIKSWKETHKKKMRLANGIVMILLGIVLILWNAGFFHF